MKIIEFGPTLFRLPDDFQGGVPEALRELANVYEELSKTPSQKKAGRPSTVSKRYEDFRVERLGKFLSAVEEGGKLDGLISLMEGDVENLTEVDIDEGWKL